MVTDSFKPPDHTTLQSDRSSSLFSDFDPYEQLDSIPDYSADSVVGQDVKGVACNVSFSSFCYSNGHGPVYNDGLLGAGQSQPNTSVNSCPSEKGYKSRGEGFQTNRYLKAGMPLLPKHGHANSSDRGANSLSQTEWEDRRKIWCTRLPHAWVGYKECRANLSIKYASLPCISTRG
ncbi:hypothetical protein E3N88_00948 [Mikania micrantha]|uniref:Uncharacterized protein n=1 Tax=Mikania micrantha TaxID=192012 RepID=A0A5N6PZW7_9ASTR|nr:hypothetical protein E3N88_00948 [Mikania micrantha]